MIKHHYEGTTCAICAYADDVDKDGALCRRNPPVAMITEDGVISVIPVVDLDGWCGEWYPKEQA